MPTEIPDSDEESEYEPALQETERPPPQTDQTQHSASVSDRALDVNFDDFISQTQSKQDGSSQLEQTKRSTASTQKHLREALDNRRQSASRSYDGADDMELGAKGSVGPCEATERRKRAHSEVDTGYSHTGSSQSHNKRVKTYGSSSGRLASSQELVESHEAVENAAAEQTAFQSASNAKSSSQAPWEEDDDEDVVPRARNRPRRIVNLLSDAVPNAAKILSTSNSSMGGYQSINLDFRGSGPLDINTNPFGSLSQISVDADVEHTVEQQCVELSSTVPLSASPRRPGRDAISPLTDSGFAPQPRTGTETSPDPSVPTFEEPAETQMLTSPTATSSVQKSMSRFTASSHNPYDIQQDVSTNTVYNIANPPESDKITKGQGRNSKVSIQSSVTSTQDELPGQEEPNELAVGLLKEQYKLRSGKPRSGTVEPDYQSQHDDDDLPSTKKKGKQKSVKSAPKAAEQSSPVKLPTSELNLSDEAVIGLPKENYKPRPSRRRSRMVLEEDASVMAEVETPEQIQSIELQAENSQFLQLEESIPTQKSKKAKKAKVKRAKTSAAGLLKKSEPMISDGEEDVVWMDTKPAKVKLDLPAYPLAGKDITKENAAPDEINVDQRWASQNFDEDNADAIGALAAPQKTVTVEVPARAEKEVSSPKKRGRKRKLTAEVIEDDEPGAEVQIEAEPITPTRVKRHPFSQNSARESTILQVTDTKAILAPPSVAVKEAKPSPTKQTASSSPRIPAKITHSPINPTGGKVLYRVGLSRRSAIPPLLKIVKPPVKQQTEKENFDKEGKPVDMVAETMRKWREMGALD